MICLCLPEAEAWFQFCYSRNITVFYTSLVGISCQNFVDLDLKLSKVSYCQQRKSELAFRVFIDKITLIDSISSWQVPDLWVCLAKLANLYPQICFQKCNKKNLLLHYLALYVRGKKSDDFLELLDTMLRANIDSLTSENERGDTPLHILCSIHANSCENQVAMLDFLLVSAPDAAR